MPEELTDQARRILERERAAASARNDDVVALIDEVTELLERLRDERQQLARRLRVAEEGLGIAPQLPIEAFEPDLRGRRLRDAAIAVLRQREGPGVPVHYRDWLRMLEEAGVRVGGRDPEATLLTQLARSDDVVSVRPRSGLYFLRT